MKSLSNFITESFDNYLKMSDEDIQKLIDLDKEYGELVWLHRNDYNYKDVLNKKEEREKFFAARAKGEKYYPKVELGPCNYKDDHIQERLEALLERFKAFKSCYLSKWYIESITSLISDVESRLSRIAEPTDLECPRPAIDLYDLAIETITKNKYQDIPKNSRTIEAEEARGLMQDALNELGYDFIVNLYDNMIPRMNVLPEKIVRVSSKSHYNKEDIEGLIAHEIKGHVGRRFYGYKLGLYLFVHGLPGRNITDEGMAVWNSLNIVKKPKPNILFNVAFKYLVYTEAIDKDFCELYDKMEQILKDTGNKVPENVLFSILIRNKRCTLDTKYKGGNSSDSEYFIGYNYVSKLNNQDRDDLLHYNVGPDQVYDIPTIQKFLKNNNIKPIKYIDVYIPELK